MAQGSSSPSSTLLPFLDPRPRRGSLASINSRVAAMDKDVLSQALDTIHTSASRSEALTSFHDFDGGSPRTVTEELVSGSVRGLYNRLVQSVGGVAQRTESTKLHSEPDRSTQPFSRTSAVLHSTPSPRFYASPMAGPDRIHSHGLTAIPGDLTSAIPPETSRAASSRSTDVEHRPPFSPNRDIKDSDHGLGLRGIYRGESYLSSDDDNVGPFTALRMPTMNTLAQVSSNTVASRTLTQILAHEDPAQEYGSRILGDEIHGNGTRSLESLQQASHTRVQGVDPRVCLSSGRPYDADLTNASSIADGPVQGQRRPPLRHVGVSHLPGFDPSRTSSMTDGGGQSIASSAVSAKSAILEPSPNINDALQRKRTSSRPASKTPVLAQVPAHLRRRVVSKEFWMKDENARDCFNCGQAFSTFRRKHHCRTCGQIFDSKCTTLVPGRPFGQPGSLRLCKPCEAMVYGDDDDDSTVLTEDADDRSPRLQSWNSYDESVNGAKNMESAQYPSEPNTPSIGIPVSRRNRESKRRSAVIEFDSHPALARPTSAHSLISLSRRARSSSHRRQHSRFTNTRNPRGTADDRAPFLNQTMISLGGDSAALPVFHHDNVIDPELAPFMSDQGSDEEEERPNILAAMARDSDAKSRVQLQVHTPNQLPQQHLTDGVQMVGPNVSGKPSGDDKPIDASDYTNSIADLPNGALSSTPELGPRGLAPRPTHEVAHTAAEGIAPTKQEPRYSGEQGQYGSKFHPAAALQNDLSTTGLEHVQKLLLQMLEDAKVDDTNAWANALLPAVLSCTCNVRPDVPRGDDMDMRHYVKMKKIPGGRPSDTSYISGVVFSKNLALKSMPSCLFNPRIVIVTFSIEYARHEAHFLSLEPVIAQEREYLRNLVGRITALRPQVLLVQRNVSGLALDLLDKAGIAVVYNIKESVLAAVARVTQAPMIKSVDKLAIDPSHLGRCGRFEIKTYLYHGFRKTYVLLSGCLPDLGCTIVLRGATTKVLRTVKRIAEFMCYAVYNLKLETSLMHDEMISIPANSHAQLMPLDPHGKIAPLEPETCASINDPSSSGGSCKYSKIEEESRNRILSASPFVVFMQPYILTQLRDQEQRLAKLRTLRNQYDPSDSEKSDGVVLEPSSESDFELIRPDMISVPASKDQPRAVREYLHAVHEAQLDKAVHNFDTQRRLWESFTATTNDPFDPSSHQAIVVLSSTVSSITSAPCQGPDLVGIEFYSSYNHVQRGYEEDCTLGQYIEEICASVTATCDGCGKKMHDHSRQYVHGYGQISISIQRQAYKPREPHDRIVMWSTCRICRHETNTMHMSEDTWKYSFAKYLELGFWSSHLQVCTSSCQHDIHKDYLRFFQFASVVVCVRYDKIDIYDVVVPRSIITWKVEADLTVKNAQFTLFLQRLNAFTDSVNKRLDSITTDALEEKKVLEAHDTLNDLRARIKNDHTELLRKLQRKYAGSRYYELIPLNRALRFMDEKAIEWDQAFADFENNFFPSETDIRKLALLQLKNMFLESQPSNSSAGDGSDIEDGTELKPYIHLDKSVDSLEKHDVNDEKAPHDLTLPAQGPSQEIVDPSSDERMVSLDASQIESNPTSPPQEDQAKIVERDEIRHLDLAVPHASGMDNSTVAANEASTDRSLGEDQGSSFATQPKTLGAGLLERIEQIRNRHGPESLVSESKIPRLVDLQKRDGNSGPPPLLRAQSQPSSHTLYAAGSNADHADNGEHTIRPLATEVPAVSDRRLSERLGVSRLVNKVGKVAPSLIPRSIPMKINEESTLPNVSALAKHFELLSREFENVRLRERRQRALRSRQARANPLASSQPVVEVYTDANDAVRERQHDKPSNSEEKNEKGPSVSTEPVLSQESSFVTSDDSQPRGSQEADSQDITKGHQSQDRQDLTEDRIVTSTISHTRQDSDSASGISSSLMSPALTHDLELSTELSIPEHKKNVWFKYLADFWSKRSASGWTALEYPLHGTEHVFEDSDIIVREDEPSSVVALSLACADYQNKVKTFRSQPSKQNTRRRNGLTRPSVSDLDPMDEPSAVEASLLSDTGTHMKYSFSHGQVKASCKIFYAEAFDALRRRCNVADRFVESMSRCLKYDSKGGKTKSLFLKTLDTRFIIKSLQEVELKAFNKFAPDYFSFMSCTLFHGVPSVIAKMFGLFQVTIKNPATGLDFSYYLLVMENLFYERNPNRRFDLKGSMRNRKIESTGQPDEVLLDENLVETIFESPLFVREHARKLLQASVYNDTMWLCKQNVMDYSLMAGFDDVRKELVVGIIDCIRTYTWDKKLESWIKDRGKNKPTITSPRDYRNRFRVSMMQYVLQAPSCWHQFQAQMVAPQTLKDREDGREEGEVEKEKKDESVL